jgi:hypothetical protein
MFYSIGPWAQGSSCSEFHKTFMLVTFGSSEISRHAPMQCFQNARAYFAIAIGYEHKMFIKSPPGIIVIKPFFRCN